MVPLNHPRTALRLLQRSRYPALISRARLGRGTCEVCGQRVRFRLQAIVPDDMADTAGFTPRIRAAWDRRESMECSQCGSRFRGRQMARALVRHYGCGHATSLEQLVDSEPFRSLRLLVIDDPLLERVLQQHPHHQYSDYITSLIPAMERPDIGLPYPDGTFDLVLSSDVLEHTPAYMRAIGEIHRVLKPNGHWMACLPVLMERPSRTRVLVDDSGILQYLLPPSHHCRGELDSLVFVEFGADFIDRIEAAGFAVRLYFYSFFLSDYTTIFVCQKRPQPAASHHSYEKGWQAPAGLGKATGPVLFSLDTVNDVTVSPAGSAASADTPAGNPVTIAGWAVDATVERPAGGVFVTIDGQWNIPAIYGLPRPDVEAALNNAVYTRVGFRAIVPSEALPKGRHILSLKIVTADGAAYYQPDYQVALDTR